MFVRLFCVMDLCVIAVEREVSEESAVWGAGAGGGLARFRVPHKLQIVKPLEGSLTLHTWSQLAKPTMSGNYFRHFLFDSTYFRIIYIEIFFKDDLLIVVVFIGLLEDHEGVGVRGVRSATGLGLRLYRLSDVEEDDDMPRLPHSSHVYTFTNRYLTSVDINRALTQETCCSKYKLFSTVLHPNDGSLAGSSVSSVCSSGMSSLSSSVLGSAWSSRMTSRRSSAAVSPVHSRRESLCLPPSRPHFSPTATPANSPLLGSPEQSPPPTPRPGDAPPSLHTLIASGTSILRRRTAASPAADASPAPIALQTPGSLYTGLVHRSPMEQLTCLKRNLRSPAAPPVERSDSGDTPFGVPAHPGEGALDAATAPLSRRPRARAPRPRADLGTVGAPPPVRPAPVHQSPLGTLSTLLFGRKGGLL